MDRQSRVVTATFQSGAFSVTVTPADTARSRFPAGPLRIVVFALAGSSTFRFYSMTSTITCLGGATAAGFDHVVWGCVCLGA